MSQFRHVAKTASSLICVWAVHPASGRLECRWTRPAQISGQDKASGFPAAA